MMAEETSEKFRREIDLGDGRGVTVYEADTAEGLADKILEAQRNASVHIRRVEQENRELRAARAVPETPAPEFKRRELTADEQFEIGRNLQDPTKASGAVRQLMETEFGAPVETVRSTLRTAAMIPGEIKGRDAAEVFLMNHPEIKTNGPNAKYFAKYMAGKRLAWTVQNLETAYADPELRGLLELGAAASPTTTNGNGNSAAAAGTPPAPESAAASPRFASTSIAARSSGTPRGGTGPKMPSAEEITRMSAADHRRWLRDPAFVRHEEALIASGKIR